MSKRTANQLMADAELQGVFFSLQNVERTREFTWDSLDGMRKESDPSYLWRFDSIGRPRTAHVTVRTLNPGLFSFEEEYPWTELRRYKAHVHDYGRLNTRL